jgi:hypothetical protein
MSPYTTPTAVNVRGNSRRDPGAPDLVALMRPSQNTEDNTHEFERGSTVHVIRFAPFLSGWIDIVQLWEE